MMTDLQLSLIAAGGVLIVGVFSYNKWQEIKTRKNVERAFSSSPDDVLMQAGRQEPNLTGELDQHSADAVAQDHAPHDTALNLPATDADTATTNSSAPPRKAVQLPLDSLIDCIIPLNSESAMRGDKLIPILQTFRLAGKKPVHYLGLRVKGDWEVIGHGGLYSKLKVGVQMASRSMVLNELEYSELVSRLRQIGDEIGAEADVPDMMDVMARARSLHQFVSEHDAQLGINLHTNSVPWAINTLLIALEKQGFDVRPDGRFVMPDGEGGHLFSLSTNVTVAAETTSRLTFLLDVPCVLPEKDPFAAMLACARSLSHRLDASIVDDGNQLLSDQALAEIASQVKAFYQEMEASQIPAGSHRALRLFH